MRLLVTGGLGFIGSNFILKLLEKDREIKITNVDAELYGSDHGNLAHIANSDRYNFVKANISNKKLMEELITKCDAVVNFAAESHVDRSITKQKKRMVQISTDEVFGSLIEGTADEQTKFNPSSPYAATKAAAELLINSYSTTFDSDIIITRCTNNFGPRQFIEKLIPKAIILANKNLKIPIYGKGENIRDWIFVDNHCDAVEMSLFNGKSGESYNISASNEINNLTIVKKILKIMDKSEDLIEFVEDRPGHDFRYSMTSKKISDELNWKLNTNFDEGLEKTVHWYLNNPKILNDISQTVLDPTPWKSSN